VLRLLEAPGTSGFREITVDELPAIREAAGTRAFAWVDAIAPSPDEIRALGEAFAMHPLVVEDFTQRGQRQKAEQFGDTLLVVVHVPRLARGPDELHVDLHEIDMLVGDWWLVTSHEHATDLSDETCELVSSRRDLPRNGAVAAVTALLDRLVDRYEDIVDRLAADVEEQDRSLLDSSTGDPVPELRRAARVRHAVLKLRRATGQLRELMGVLVRRELVDDGHSSGLDLELRDVYDHVVRAHDDLDILYERLSGLADTRLAVSAYRQNEITKRLSAWGAILLVPTVVTGWFGMNFHHLGFVGWRNGQWLALGVIAAVCGALWVALRRARWL
jgi:magnesium transporter